MTTLAEPEWDQATRDLALALDDCEQVHLCALCGRPKAVCQAPERQFDWQVGAPIRCHATTALSEAQKAVTEESNPHKDALMWPIQLREQRS